jgi:hypothetical protein
MPLVAIELSHSIVLTNGCHRFLFLAANDTRAVRNPIDAMIQADNNAAIPLVLVIKSKLGHIALSKPVISIQ